MDRIGRTGSISAGAVKQRTSGRPGRVLPRVEDLESRSLLSVAGAFDTGFATNGQYIVPVQAEGSRGLINFYSIKVQASGKIDAAGSVGTTDHFSYGVLQLNPDGTPDASFGTKGEVDLTLPDGLTADERLSTELLLPGGKIFLAGTAYDSAHVEHTVTAELNADGSLNSSYGMNGIQVLPESGWSLRFAADQSDGKIVLVGFAPIPSVPTDSQLAAVRINADGSADTTFGYSGTLLLSDATPSELAGSYPVKEAGMGVAIDGSNRIVILAQLNIADGSAPTSQVELFRFNPDGSHDSTLSESGVKASGLAFANMNGVLLEPDGNIVVVGAGSYGLAEAMLARFSPSGGLMGSAKTPAPFPASSIPDNSGYVINQAIETPDGQFVMTGDEFRPSFITIRLNNDFTPDATFGTLGEVRNTIDGAQGFSAAEVIAVTPDDRIVEAGTSTSSTNYVIAKTYGASGQAPTATSPVATPVASAPVLSPVTPTIRPEVPGDYTGSGLTNPAVYLPASGSFDIRSADGSPDRIIPFGIPGVGQSIPASGDYDGSGRTELAVYLPSIGAFAIRPADGSADRIIPFGIAGAGQSIPAPGDYDGSGRTELAVYLPSIGAFAFRPADGGPDRIIPFGIAGAGQSIPAPGDYDGSGHTDLAVYLPSIGSFAIRPALGGPDRIIPFGIAGAGQSIPIPGDYLGDGRTDLAVYMPSSGSFAVRPDNGQPDVVEPFGVAGAGQSIPLPGYYDGTGRDNLGVYLPGSGTLAIRPSSGPDLIGEFGTAGTGQSISTDGAVTADPIQASDPVVPAAVVAVKSVKVTKHVVKATAKRKA